QRVLVHVADRDDVTEPGGVRRVAVALAAHADAGKANPLVGRFGRPDAPAYPEADPGQGRRLQKLSSAGLSHTDPLGTERLRSAFISQEWIAGSAWSH